MAIVKTLLTKEQFGAGVPTRVFKNIRESKDVTIIIYDFSYSTKTDYIIDIKLEQRICHWDYSDIIEPCAPTAKFVLRHKNESKRFRFERQKAKHEMKEYLKGEYYPTIDNMSNEELKQMIISIIEHNKINKIYMS